jgi:hypothetical protein
MLRLVSFSVDYHWACIHTINVAILRLGTDAECLKHGSELSDKKHTAVFRPRSTSSFLHTRSMRRYRWCDPAVSHKRRRATRRYADRFYITLPRVETLVRADLLPDVVSTDAPGLDR